MKTKICCVLILCLILISLPGCGLIEAVFELSEEMWVEIIDKELLVTGRTLHLQIVEGAIWEDGDEAAPLRQQIRTSLQVKIDDVPIAEDQLMFLDTLQFPIDVTDPNGQKIGSHYDSTHVYVFPLNLSEGAHQGFIEVTGLSGIRHTYSWNFTVIYEA